MADETNATGPRDAASDAPAPRALPENVVAPAPASNPQPTAPLVPPPAPNPPDAPGIRDDIKKILAEVKLPERRDMPGAEKAQLPAAQPPVGLPHAPEVPVKTIEAPAPKDPNEIRSVHTLKDDLQNVVRDQKISVVRAVSLEEDRRHRAGGAQEEAAGTVQRSRRFTGVIFSVVLLLLLGVGALFGVYTIMAQRSGGQPPQMQSSILFAENTVALPLTGQSSADVKKILAGARTSGTGVLGSITRIIPTVTETTSGAAGARPATFAEFMSALGAQPPDELVRALGSDFFFGIHTVDKQAPIIIVTVLSYDHAFAGMLAWEARMNPDLAPVFTPVPTQVVDQSGLPTPRAFQDLVMRNYDVRALKDDTGAIELYYSFPTQNLLVIAESPYSFTEILSRLQAQRKL